LTPWTAYRFDAGKKQFFAASGPGSDVSAGMLLIANPNDYDVVEMDVDGAARKVQDFRFERRSHRLREVLTSIDSPAAYGLRVCVPPVSPLRGPIAQGNLSALSTRLALIRKRLW